MNKCKIPNSIGIVFFILWLFIHSLNAQNNICFSDVNDYKFQSGGIEIKAADFNNDGHKDVLTLGAFGNFYINYGSGDGNFSPPVTFSTATNATLASVADINLDGYIDIALLLGNNSVAVMKNLSGTTFTLDATIVPAFTINSLSFEFINYDQYPDLLFANGSSNQAYIYPGNGTSTYVQSFTVPCSSPQQAFVTADFNNDQVTDIAFLKMNGDVDMIYLDSTGIATATFGIPGANGCEGITHGDFNNDGLQDLVLFGMGNWQHLLLINSNQLTSWGSIPRSYGPIQTLVCGDWNQDGITDIAFGKISSDVITVHTMTNNYQSSSEKEYEINYELCNGTWKMTSGDFNEDGFSDILGVSFSPRFHNLIGTGTGDFRGVKKYPGYGSFQLGYVDDFNNDTKPDVIKYTTTGLMYISLNAGNDFVETFTMGIPYGFGNICSKDLNLDGFVDLVICKNYPYETEVYAGNGTGTFSLVATLLGINGVPKILDCKDLNNDGLPEIFCSCEFTNTNFVSYYIFKNNGNFSFSSSISSQLVHESLRLADVNNDSFLDIVTIGAAGYQHDSYVLFGNGNLSAYSISKTQTLNITSTVFDLVDMDKNGTLDLIISGPNGIDILSGNGAGDFNYTVTISGVSGMIKVADLNNDKLPDLFSSSSGAYQNLGNFNFSAPNFFYINKSPYTLSFHDFNGDSLPDIFAADVSMCNYDIHYNTSAVIFGPNNHVFCEPSSIVLRGNTTEAYKFGWINMPSASATIAVSGSGTYSFSTSNLNNSCKSTSEYSALFVECATNVNMQSKSSSIAIYPSPTTGNLWLENKTEHSLRIEIISSSGQSVATFCKKDAGKFNFSIEDLPNGLYLVNCESDLGFYTQKIIKE